MCSLVITPFSRGFLKALLVTLIYLQCYNAVFASIQYLNGACFLAGKIFIKACFSVIEITCLYALNFVCDYFVVLDILWLLWDRGVSKGGPGRAQAHSNVGCALPMKFEKIKIL